MSSYVEQHTITKVQKVKKTKTKTRIKTTKTLMKHRNKIIYQDLKHVKPQRDTYSKMTPNNVRRKYRTNYFK
jgi:hypothetical protein